MHRRTYLGLAATGVVGSVAGCATASDGREYPPYPDSETTELSGDGTGTSDRFESMLDGPTLVDLEHEGSDNFTVVLAEPETADDESAPANDSTGEMNGSTNDANESDEPSTNESTVSPGNETADTKVDESVVATVATAVGPYDGRSLVPVATGSYVLRVVEADAEWTATVYDLPVYEDGVGTSLPIEREGNQYDVIGPVDFGEQSDTEFGFSVSGEGLHRVFVTDREGSESLTVFSVNGDSDESLSQQVGGVGYIEVLSFGEWTFELS
jgi:hypothetical protein